MVLMNYKHCKIRLIGVFGVGSSLLQGVLLLTILFLLLTKVVHFIIFFTTFALL